SDGSKIGGRISPKPKVAKTECAVSSTWFHSAVSGGRRSRVPRMAWNLRRCSFFGAASVTSFFLGHSSAGRVRRRPLQLPAKTTPLQRCAPKTAGFRKPALQQSVCRPPLGDFLQVDIFVLDVAMGVAIDRGLVIVGQRALYFSGRAH